MKEFNLSEKILWNAFEFPQERLAVQDVKEFIKLLKPSFCPMCGDKFENCDCEEPAFTTKWLRETIDKLAGKSLK